MNTNIIDSADPGIVVQETTIKLSDEKLRSLLSHTYEEAQKNSSATKFSKYYGTFLSIAGTLFVALLTSTFKPIFGISAEIVTIIAMIICALSAIVGFICMAITVTNKIRNDTSERDKTVENILSRHLSSRNQP